MPIKGRKHYRPEEKVAILRKHLLEKEPISKICDEYRLQPTVFYRWQRQLFEKGAMVFVETVERERQELRKTIAELEEKLSSKNEVLGELMEEYVKIKKKNGRS